MICEPPKMTDHFAKDRHFDNSIETSSNKSTNLVSSASSITEENPVGLTQINKSQDLELIIDVQRKKKVFNSYEERRRYKQDYQRKIKTELCKTWQLRGSCKYGNNCSFAHGKDELKEKTHLHSNYKTKPCQQYFLKGYCVYGYRCQYLHSEIKYLPEFHSFLADSYENAQISLKKFKNFIPESIILRQMMQLYCESNNIQDFYYQLPKLSKKRLPCFADLSKTS